MAERQSARMSKITNDCGFVHDLKMHPTPMFAIEHYYKAITIPLLKLN